VIIVKEKWSIKLLSSSIGKRIMQKSTLPDKLNETNGAEGSEKEFTKRKAYVRQRLRELGLNIIEPQRTEAMHLPYMLHKDEKIGAIAVGRGKAGHIMLVATDRRIIVLDVKPLFKNEDLISYDTVAGVKVSNVGPIYNVTLQTRLGDFVIETVYAKAAKLFEEYITEKCLEHQIENGAAK
jgi:hypothetical protein